MKKVYMQVSTHWDREWYNHFQAFRYDLVGTTEKILQELSSKDTIDNFVFDGQTIVIEDYLEIKPQEEARLKQAIQKGEIKIGPWYVMPDEFLVSGESLIRNFLTGKQVAKQFGTKPYAYGYVNDIFGHIAQFPQLLNKFGIKMAYLGRGLGGPGNDFRHFVWKSPDGSRCLAYKYNYSKAYQAYLNFVQQDNRTEEEKDAWVREYIYDELDKCKNDILLLNVTDDHVDLNDVMLDFIKRVKKIEEIEVITSGFMYAYDDIATSVEKLPIKVGELIETSYDGNMRLVTDSISSYYNLKAHNDRCQMILEQKTAPMIAYAHLMGENMPIEFLQTAYKYLLKNHPHDNICGCSTDQVHKDMQYRYDQVKEMSKAIRRDFVCRMKKRKVEDGDDYCLEIFNPAPYRREQMVTVDLEFDRDYAYRRTENTGHQSRNMFRLFDVAGNEIEYQILDIKQNILNDDKNITQRKKRIDIYTITFPATLTAFGMTEYLVKPSNNLVRNKKSMQSGDVWVENQYARVEIASDGTFTLFDKITGKIYDKLHYFVDDAEAGNGWFHEDAGNQNVEVTSRFSPCVVEKVECGSQQVTFRVIKTMSIPECMEYDTYNRSSSRVDMKLVSRITLKADSGKVYIETVVDNCAKDHRLKLMLPTNIKGDTYCASQAFYFAERTVGANPETIHWHEQDPQEKHFDGIIYKRDEEGVGLAFVGQHGFHQAGVQDDMENTISIVLLRSFGRAYLVSESEYCQIQGKHTYQYTIVPMNKNTSRCDLLNSKKYDFIKEEALSIRCASGIQIHQQDDVLHITGENVAISIVKPSENDMNTLILRVFNTASVSTSATVKSKYVAELISTTDLYETPQKLLAENSKQVTFELAPYEILTIAFQYKRREEYVI